MIITSYYFFIPSSKINLLINSNNYLQKDIQQVETKLNIIEELTPEIEINIDEYLKIEELDQRIAEYIKKNSAFNLILNNLFFGLNKSHNFHF